MINYITFIIINTIETRVKKTRPRNKSQKKASRKDPALVRLIEFLNFYNISFQSQATQGIPAYSMKRIYELMSMELYFVLSFCNINCIQYIEEEEDNMEQKQKYNLMMFRTMFMQKIAKYEEEEKFDKFKFQIDMTKNIKQKFIEKCYDPIMKTDWEQIINNTNKNEELRTAKQNIIVEEKYIRLLEFLKTYKISLKSQKSHFIRKESMNNILNKLNLEEINIMSFLKINITTLNEEISESKEISQILSKIRMDDAGENSLKTICESNLRLVEEKCEKSEMNESKNENQIGFTNSLSEFEAAENLKQEIFKTENLKETNEYLEKQEIINSKDNSENSEETTRILKGGRKFEGKKNKKLLIKSNNSDQQNREEIIVSNKTNPSETIILKEKEEDHKNLERPHENIEGTMSIGSHNENFHKLEKEAENLESVRSEINRNSSSYEKEMVQSKIELDGVKNLLPENPGMLENKVLFIDFNNDDNMGEIKPTESFIDYQEEKITNESTPLEDKPIINENHHLESTDMNHESKTELENKEETQYDNQPNNELENPNNSYNKMEKLDNKSNEIREVTEKLDDVNIIDRDSENNLNYEHSNVKENESRIDENETKLVCNDIENKEKTDEEIASGQDLVREIEEVNEIKPNILIDKCEVTQTIHEYNHDEVIKNSTNEQYLVEKGPNKHNTEEFLVEEPEIIVLDTPQEIEIQTQQSYKDENIVDTEVNKIDCKELENEAPLNKKEENLLEVQNIKLLNHQDTENETPFNNKEETLINSYLNNLESREGETEALICNKEEISNESVNNNLDHKEVSQYSINENREIPVEDQEIKNLDLQDDCQASIKENDKIQVENDTNEKWKEPQDETKFQKEYECEQPLWNQKREEIYPKNEIVENYTEQKSEEQLKDINQNEIPLDTKIQYDNELEASRNYMAYSETTFEKLIESEVKNNIDLDDEIKEITVEEKIFNDVNDSEPKDKINQEFTDEIRITHEESAPKNANENVEEISNENKVGYCEIEKLDNIDIEENLNQNCNKEENKIAQEFYEGEEKANLNEASNEILLNPALEETNLNNNLTKENIQEEIAEEKENSEIKENNYNAIENEIKENQEDPNEDHRHDKQQQIATENEDRINNKDISLENEPKTNDQHIIAENISNLNTEAVYGNNSQIEELCINIDEKLEIKDQNIINNKENLSNNNDKEMSLSPETQIDQLSISVNENSEPQKPTKSNEDLNFKSKIIPPEFNIIPPLNTEKTIFAKLIGRRIYLSEASKAEDNTNLNYSENVSYFDLKKNLNQNGTVIYSYSQEEPNNSYLTETTESIVFKENEGNIGSKYI